MGKIWWEYYYQSERRLDDAELELRRSVCQLIGSLATEYVSTGQSGGSSHPLGVQCRFIESRIGGYVVAWLAHESTPRGYCWLIADAKATFSPSASTQISAITLSLGRAFFERGKCGKEKEVDRNEEYTPPTGDRRANSRHVSGGVCYVILLKITCVA